MKPKREITLGEMKDACDLYYSKKTPCAKCEYKNVCSFYKQEGLCHIDLADPPRFTEAQMALLKALWGIGAKKVRVVGMGIVALSEKGLTIYLADILREIEGETLDLAELFQNESEAK